MIEQIDKSIFLFINSFNNPFWDRVMWIISGKTTWIPLYLAIIVLLAFRYRSKMLILVPLIVLAITASDQLSVHAFKEVFMRLRPCHEPSLEGLVHIVNGKCPGKYGFVSSHASNSFAAAVLSLLLIRKKWFTWSILAWASIVGYSRIYLGVHYPGDVICGGLLGVLVGYLVFWIFRLLDKKLSSMNLFSKKEKTENVSV